MRGKFQPWYYVLFAFILVGIVFQLFNQPEQMIIPVVIFGAVFLFYKFPPSRSRNKTRSASSSQERMQTKQRNRKPIPFRVIEGGKEDDNLPKYH
jgi:hypothetical protein